MKIGIPKEIKDQEGRVGMAPEFVREFVADGHKVFVQSSAGLGIGAQDSHYKEAGATILDSIEEIYEAGEMIIKIKEPLAPEFPLMRKDQIMFTFLHLAAEPAATRAFVESGSRGVAYETITDRDGRLPLLAQSSKVAGRISIHKSIQYLQWVGDHKGKGLLFGGVPGVRPAKVMIVGGGYAGRHAAQVALAAGADVTILDISSSSLESIFWQFQGRVRTLYCSRYNLLKEVKESDVVIGAALVVGDKAPKLLKKEDLKLMEPGGVIVDISIDQGGCFETSRLTSHSEPIFVEEGIIHYCVPNMPGVVPKTSTYALNSATFPFAKAMADLGLDEAMERDPHLKRGLNVDKGKIVHPVIQKVFPSLPQ